ncbi:hypothetical protein ACFQNF_06220 [Iodobacter arcticus]|uniref:Acetyltransferase n=1 Tax=Iodobacter arcticus TaxID=590593 RepID=A0ABW2QUS4_9NEIS
MLKVTVIAANNTAALAFWQREGFVELHRKPTEGFTADAIVMEWRHNES